MALGGRRRRYSKKFKRVKKTVTKKVVRKCKPCKSRKRKSRKH